MAKPKSNGGMEHKDFVPGPKLVGHPCGTCMFFEEHVVGAGVSWCLKGYGYQWPDDRPWNCEAWGAKDCLEAAMIALRTALIWNRIAREWATGTNVGTPDDPRHPTYSKKEQARRTEEGNERQREYVRCYKMAEGTGL